MTKNHNVLQRLEPPNNLSATGIRYLQHFSTETALHLSNTRSLSKPLAIWSQPLATNLATRALTNRPVWVQPSQNCSCVSKCFLLSEPGFGVFCQGCVVVFWPDVMEPPYLHYVADTAPVKTRAFVPLALVKPSRNQIASGERRKPMMGFMHLVVWGCWQGAADGPAGRCFELPLNPDRRQYW